MKITIKHVKEESVSTLASLYNSYVAELATYTEIDPEITEPNRLNQYLQPYWNDNNHWAYLIEADDEIAGFCLVKRLPSKESVTDIDQFFILDRFKHRGIGKQVFFQLLRYHPGAWVIRVLENNTPALGFWLAVVDEATNGKFTHTRELDGNLPMHFVRFRTEATAT